MHARKGLTAAPAAAAGSHGGHHAPQQLLRHRGALRRSKVQRGVARAVASPEQPPCVAAIAAAY
eukprot:COSAG01_NODE_8556_length_2743_cov_8.364977_2_plen_64_part_00